MKRSIVTILILGLLAGSLASVAEAKKKPKKKPLVASEEKFFLHWEGDGATPPGCTENVYMDLKDTAGDASCSTTTQVAQDALEAAGQDPITTVFPATEGVPFVLDASRKLTGKIVLSGTFTVNGKAQLDLTGTVDGQAVTLATGETGTANGALSNNPSGLGQLPGPGAELTVELPFDAAFDKKTVSDLTLTVTIRGLHRGGIDYERDPANIVVPTWATK